MQSLKETKTKVVWDGLKPVGWQPVPLLPDLLLSPSGELVQAAENHPEDKQDDSYCVVGI